MTTLFKEDQIRHAAATQKYWHDKGYTSVRVWVEDEWQTTTDYYGKKYTSYIPAIKSNLYRGRPTE